MSAATWRRFPVLGVVIACLVAYALVGRSTPATLQGFFAAFDAPGMPELPPVQGLTETWFCPGVPGGGVEGAEDQGGTVVIANSGDASLRAVVTTITADQASREQTIDVAARTRESLDIAAQATSPFVAATVEIAGGTGIVEQIADRPEGRSVSPCSSATSTAWYFADGYTSDGSVEQLVITNPYDQTAVLDIGFATDDGPREPSALQGYPVPPRSLRVIDLADSGVTDEPIIGVDVLASAGQVVVGRAQDYTGGGRRGFTMTLASPQLRDQWWFAHGRLADGVSEEYRLYNPTDETVEVNPVVLGVPFVEIAPLEIEPRSVGSFVVDAALGIEEGPHAVVFGTGQERGIVVEQVLTQTIEDRLTTSVLVGATSRPSDAFIASTWYVGVGPTEPTSQALAVYNPDATDANLTVSSVGSDGITPIPSLSEISLPANGLITIDLTEAVTLDRELVVTSTGRIFVERLLRRDDGAEGRVASWAVPAGD